MFFHCSSSILWPFINGSSIADSTKILYVQIQLKGSIHDSKAPAAHAENAGWLGINHEIVHFLGWFCLSCSTDLSTNWTCNSRHHGRNQVLWDMMLWLSHWVSGSQYFTSTMIIWNTGNHSSGNTAVYMRKLKSSRTPHEKPKSGNFMGDSENTFSSLSITWNIKECYTKWHNTT
jgi:hypothetical protein